MNDIERPASINSLKFIGDLLFLISIFAGGILLIVLFFDDEKGGMNGDFLFFYSIGLILSGYISNKLFHGFSVVIEILHDIRIRVSLPLDRSDKYFLSDNDIGDDNITNEVDNKEMIEPKKFFKNFLLLVFAMIIIVLIFYRGW